MINFSNISIHYGNRTLFDNLSFVITKKDRLGLVGKNGAGKSTLMKIVVEEIVPHDGSISMDNGTRLGYLPQNLELNPTLSVYEEAAKAFSNIKELEREVEQLTEEIGNRTDYESVEYSRLIENLTSKQDQLLRQGVGSLRERVEKILKGLGFINGDFDRPLATFSGGWQMRVELAKILLQLPDFILLDEPTNHLDIESIMWLEGFLKNYPGGVILISHDRAFLDAVTNRTIELVNGSLFDYKSSYSKFVELRKERIAKQIDAAKRQAKEIEHTKELINKFRAKKNKAAFAQTLIRKLEKTEIIEVDDEENSKISFKFPDAPRSGQIVVKIEGLTKSYGSNTVLKNVDFELERGEKIAFVGKNGEGKTTLTKIINNLIDYEGKCEIGYNVDIAYFEQHQAEKLKGDQTVFQVIDDAATGDLRARVRQLLAAFLFSGEDVDKKVMVLSGGEKSRLALAKMLLEPMNLLILDEPTNHLDMQAKEVLKNAIKAYNGTLIVVSHDRDFLHNLTDKVYEFRDSKLHMHFGDVYNFLEAKNLQNLDDLNLGNKRKEQQINSGDSKKGNLKESRQALRDLEKNLKRVSNQNKKQERVIQDFETSIAECEGIMGKADFYTSHNDPDSIIKKHKEAGEELLIAMEAWEDIQVELEALEEERTALNETIAELSA